MLPRLQILAFCSIALLRDVFEGQVISLEETLDGGQLLSAVVWGYVRHTLMQDVWGQSPVLLQLPPHGYSTTKASSCLPSVHRTHYAGFPTNTSLKGPEEVLFRGKEEVLFSRGHQEFSNTAGFSSLEVQGTMGYSH